ncbi:cupin domain-containing protein [Flavobacterium sp. W21_SRS_FM6]|uniref:cupin domain-containing protein n=1 Tax=Flavobacterium sp. W21_SRS_FM6 TaxID=3240268 RepID=UPI003F916E89
MKKFTLCLINSMALLTLACSPQKALDTQGETPIEVKVVVVNMFEIGEDQGDKAGEFQLWKAGQKLDTCVPFPASYHDICLNPKTGVLGIVTGMGTARAASAIMALGLDPRFDLTKSYWLVVGIAGVDPHDASIGSAVWANYLVDGDLAHEVDARDMPADWQTGYFPLFQEQKLDTTTDFDASTYQDSPNGEVYQLNQALSNWAFELTKDVTLSDYPAMEALRAKYINYPNAQKPPFVLQGDQLAAATFWHGKHLTEWANDWVRYWTKGQGNFVTSGMEDTGSYQAITYLDNAKKADKSRFMVLRTASNYSMPPDSMTALDNLIAEGKGYVGMQSSLESAYAVGSVVVDNIVANWPQTKTLLPYEIQNDTRPTPQAGLSAIKPTTTTKLAQHLSTEELVKALNLEDHVEGGFFRQTFKAEHRPMIKTEAGPRVTMTSIYYLLSAESPIGHFHMNQSDIMHYFHMGDPITYTLIHPDGHLETIVMGSDPNKGQVMQMMVKGGIWKASNIPTDGEYGYGLIGEAVAPGFEYSDMQLGDKAALSAQFPQHKQLINQLSH